MQVKRYPISVHLVTHNGAAWLPFGLESLGHQTRQDFFCLIIDNGSADASPKLIRDFLANSPEIAQRTRLVLNKQNLGFAKAHNQAMLWTDSDFVLVLNQDVVLSPTYLANLTQALLANPRIAAVTGKLMQWRFNPETFHLGAVTDLLPAAAIDSVGLKLHRSRRVTNLGQGESDPHRFWQAQAVFGVAGTAPLYRRQALQQVSPQGLVFDEYFVSYKEDVDLAWRLALAGWEAWYVPEALALHERGLSGGEQLTRREQMLNRRAWSQEQSIYSWVNHWGVIIKHESLFNLLRDLPWVAWHELQKFVYLLVLKPVVLVRAFLRLFKLLPIFLAERAELAPSRQLKPSDLRKWFKPA